MISTEDSIIRLIMALILGGLIGYERRLPAYGAYRPSASSSVPAISS